MTLDIVTPVRISRWDLQYLLQAFGRADAYVQESRMESVRETH